MTAPQRRRLQRLLQESYPIAVVRQQQTFWACLPDLPAVCGHSTDLGQLYARLEVLRRDYVAQQVARDAPVALPNTHLARSSAA